MNLPRLRTVRVLLVLMSVAISLAPSVPILLAPMQSYSNYLNPNEPKYYSLLMLNLSS
jgi:hypothetical protein